MNGYSGKTTLTLNGKQLLLQTFDNSPPFITPCHLVVAVERTSDNSLHAIACYIKNENNFVDTGHGLLLLFSTLLFVGGGSLALLTWSIMSFANIEIFSGIIGMFLGLFNFLIGFYYPFSKFFEFRKASKVINLRLQRIKQLEKRNKVEL
jgi:hypothetical protein